MPHCNPVNPFAARYGKADTGEKGHWRKTVVRQPFPCGLFQFLGICWHEVRTEETAWEDLELDACAEKEAIADPLMPVLNGDDRTGNK